MSGVLPSIQTPATISTLKRSKAVRKPSNSLSKPHSDSKPAISVASSKGESDMAHSSGSDPAQRAMVEDDNSDDCYPGNTDQQVSGLKRSGAHKRRTNFKHKIRFIRTLIAAMNELQAEQASESGSSSSSQEIAVNDPNWRDSLVWDLTGVLHLRRLLAMWAEGNVPASDIGLFLVKVLYQRDEHLDHRLTRMVELHESYTDIAVALMKHYQIRNMDDQPLWERMNLGDANLRPDVKTASVTESATISSTACSSPPTAISETTAVSTQESCRRMASSPVLDLPARWPFYVNGADLEDFFHNSEDGSDDEDYRYRKNDLSSMALSTAERQVKMGHTGPLPESMAAEIISSPDVSASQGTIDPDTTAANVGTLTGPEKAARISRFTEGSPYIGSSQARRSSRHRRRRPRPVFLVARFVFHLIARTRRNDVSPRRSRSMN